MFSAFKSARGSRGSETYRFSATYTLSDFPLLIGEILRRSEHRSELQAKRRWLIEKIQRIFPVR
jgi:hypothetical protein